MRDQDTRLLLRFDIDQGRDAGLTDNALVDPQAVANVISSWLDQTEETLYQIEENHDRAEIGAAILRVCQNLADGVSRVATELEHTSENNRREFAQNLCQSVENHPLLLHEEYPRATAFDTSLAMTESTMTARPIAEDDVMQAFSAIGGFLRDVEDTLRCIEECEADELATAAFSVAHIALSSAKSVTESIGLSARQESVVVEDSNRVVFLDDDEDKEEDMNTSDKQRSVTSPITQKRLPRVVRKRALWPPLGPAVASSLAWGKHEACQRPVVAVAIGALCWPAAVVSVFVGTPLIVMDGFLQRLYNDSQDTAVVRGMEEHAGRVYETSRFGILCAKFTAKRGIRVASRQLKRHGGIGKIAASVRDAAIHHAMHPVETIGAASQFIAWGFSSIHEKVTDLLDQEKGATVQDLQQ